MHATRTVLRPVGRLDVPAVLAFLGAHAVPGVEHWDGSAYTRSLVVEGRPAVVTLTAAEDAAEGAADGADGADGAVAVLARGVPADHPDLVRRLRHLTGCDDDSAPAEAHLAADPVLAGPVRDRPGLRVPGSVDHLETLLRTIIGQQVSLAGAATTTARLVAAAGRPLPHDLVDACAGVTHLFPSAAAVARLDPTGLPMPRARARTVTSTAAALAGSGGRWEPDALPADDALLAVPGVGPWTAGYVRLRTRRDPDVLLPTDLAVRRSLTHHGLDLAATVAWAPYRSTAMVHLWVGYLARRSAA
ncbi:DNA-3-methyladenine glycosylase 2 [Thalassiella azotivora]